MRDDGALPMVVIVVIIGFIMLIVALFAIAITLQVILALFLVGAGMYLLLRSDKIAGLGNTAKIVVPFALIVLGIAVYGGWV